MGKHLWVLRHATAEYIGVKGADFLRNLTLQGQQEAAAVGRWLASNGVTIDRVVASPSLRTTQTAEAVAREIGYQVNIHFEESIYEADIDDLVRAMIAIPDDVDNVLLIGHNPGLEGLIEVCTSSHSSLRTQLLPASLAHVTFSSSWGEALEGVGQFGGINHVVIE